MSFPYKKVLVVGATSGIGEALAAKMISNGINVITVGRRQDKLDAFVAQHGKAHAAAVPFDITQLAQIPQFAASITAAHPDLDAVLLNSGIQRAVDFSQPETVDLGVLELELNTNYLSFLHLTVAFLPFLQKKQAQTALIYTTSGLALVPMLRCSNYCASKAALHHLILCLREQLKAGPGDVKVIEIFPPAVQTELHDAKHQPDIKNGGQIGMPLDEFTEEAWSGLSAGHDQVAVGMSKMSFDSWEQERQKAFHTMTEQMAFHTMTEQMAKMMKEHEQ